MVCEIFNRVVSTFNNSSNMFNFLILSLLTLLYDFRCHTTNINLRIDTPRFELEKSDMIKHH